MSIVPHTPALSVQAGLIEQLEELMPKVPANDQGFAKGLVGQYKTKGFLSKNQWPWVSKMIGKAQDGPDKLTMTEEIPGFEGIYALFEKTQGKLKYPAITLGLAHAGQMLEVRFDIGGNSSLHPGAVRAKLVGTSLLLGYVTKDGVWRPREAAAKYEPNLTALIKNLGQNPAEVAKSWGHLSGKCCFCNSKLTDEKSTGVGYGPTCAKQYGLPWGANWSQHAAAVGKDLLTKKPLIVGVDFGKAEAAVLAQIGMTPEGAKKLNFAQLYGAGPITVDELEQAAKDIAEDGEEYPFSAAELDAMYPEDDDDDPIPFIEDEDEDDVLAAVYGDAYKPALGFQIEPGEQFTVGEKLYQSVASDTIYVLPNDLSAYLQAGTVVEKKIPTQYEQEEAVAVAQQMVKERPSRKLVAGSACATLIAEMHG